MIKRKQSETTTSCGYRSEVDTHLIKYLQAMKVKIKDDAPPETIEKELDDLQDTLLDNDDKAAEALKQARTVGLIP